MRLTDVARASLSELANDYINWILLHEKAPWSVKSSEHREVTSIQLDRPTYKEDVQYESSVHIIKQKHKFDEWFLSKGSLIEGNCLIVLCHWLGRQGLPRDILCVFLNKTCRYRQKVVSLQCVLIENLPINGISVCYSVCRKILYQ